VKKYFGKLNLPPSSQALCLKEEQTEKEVEAGFFKSAIYYVLDSSYAENKSDIVSKKISIP